MVRPKSSDEAIQPRMRLQAALSMRHLVIVRPPSDSAPHRAEQRENQAYHDQDDANRPQDRDVGQKADDEKYHSKCYH
jgi:hypothetical protein